MMDKSTLLEFENRCVQEQPPECEAACPFHLDVRGFVGAIARGDWPTAWKILRKTLPVPGILGRICDAPCRNRCKRREAGDPIDIGELERACVTLPAPVFRVQPFPRKGKRVAVIGSGLSSLTAAWDLVRKGYDVRVFEPGIAAGCGLKDRYPDRLTTDGVDAEIARLIRLGVAVETDVAVESSDFLESCIADHDAVYLGLDGVSRDAWDIDRTPDGRISVIPRIQTVSRDGVFAGGASLNHPGSPVWQASEGRWAGASIDRYLQKVSLTAGREKDGPYVTRLFTRLTGVDFLPAVSVKDPARGYTPEEAMAEADRCLQCQCLECVRVCPYLEQFGAYPGKYAREIYNNESIVMGVRQANKLINSCSLCGLCETICPEGFPMQVLCLTARQSMVRRGKMPPSAHEFALMDMAFSQSEHFAMARHEPGRSESAYLFFPGCQLSASSPDHTARLYGHLRKTLAGGVGLMLGCCAAPAGWAGREDLFQAELAALRNNWEGLGRPRIIAACATCFRTLREPQGGFPVISVWQVLAETGLPDSDVPTLSGPVAVHDPCTARHEPGVRQSVRDLLRRMGVPVEELTLSGETTECCGFGGLMQNANPDLAEEVIRKRARQSPRDYVAYCAMCRDTLSAAGKRALHLLDLIFSDPAQPDPAARRRPVWSERRENRSRLKTQLLRDLWGEIPVTTNASTETPFHIPSDVMDIMDRRRILVEDIRETILHAETSGEKARHPATGRFRASYKTANTTFWVEYSSHPDGFTVHNAYAHRMEVIRP